MTTLDLYCPTCRKVTRHKVFPNDMVPMPHGLREWGLYCDCGTSYNCAAGMKYDNAVRSALLDAYEASKMFWTDKERCNDEMQRRKEKPMQASNVQKMREALESAIWLCIDAIEVGEYMGEGPDPAFEKIKKVLSAAVAAPARQCDVGTPNEQAERFVKHCQSFLNRYGIKACVGCPCCGVVKYGKCELAWAQTPYEAQEGAGE